MTEEWRVEVDLEDEQHGPTLSERLRSLDLDDEARERLGDRVVVTRDGPRMFLYAATEQQAREAERVASDLAAAEGLSAQTALSRWHPDEEAWKDPSVPFPETDEERAAEERRHEIAEERAGRHEWEVRVDLPLLRETLDLAGRLEDEGLEVHRRWRHLLVGAATENQAAELADRIRPQAPRGGAGARRARAGRAAPVFVYIEAHKPGIARDLGPRSGPRGRRSGRHVCLLLLGAHRCQPLGLALLPEHEGDRRDDDDEQERRQRRSPAPGSRAVRTP